MSGTTKRPGVTAINWDDRRRGRVVTSAFVAVLALLATAPQSVAEGATAPAMPMLAQSNVVTQVPVRIADIPSFTPGVVRCVPVVGLANVPAGATGVILNVTAAGAAGGGNVVVYPDYSGNDASAPPSSSTVNFEKGQDVANAAFVALPADGKVCAYSQGAELSRLILDVTGYLTAGSGITLQNSQRLFDTRGGTFPVAQAGPVSQGDYRTVQVTGNAGVPGGATAVLVNVTVTGVADPGHLRMWATGRPIPNTSVVNYAPGQDKANAQVVALSASGQLSYASFSGGSVHVIVDVVGYVSGSTHYVAIAPTRIVETRASYGQIGPIGGRLSPNSRYSVSLQGGLVPATATAVVLNVTAVQPSGPGHLRVYPDMDGLATVPMPDVSSLNYIEGRDIPNLVVVKMPTNWLINFYNVQGGADSTDLVVDVVGYIDIQAQVSEPVSLSIGTWGSAAPLEARAAEYMALNPNVTIAVETGDYTAHHDTINQALIAGSGTHNIELIDDGFINFFTNQADGFVNLADLGAGQYKADYLPWKWSQASNADESVTIGLGADVGGLAMCYRRDLFQAAGLPYERDQVAAAMGDGWDGFITFGEAYQAATGGDTFLDDAGNVFLPAVQQLGTGYAFYDRTDTLDMVSVKPAFDTAMDVYSADISANIDRWSPEWNAGFRDGAFAVTLCPSWMLPYISGNIPSSATGVQWDVADLPGPGGNWGGAFYTIPAQGSTYEQEESYNFVQWLIQPTQQVALMNATGELPAQTAILEGGALPTLSQPHFNSGPYGEIFAKTAVDIPEGIYYGPKHNSVWGAVQDVISDVENGNIYVGDAWAEAVAAAEASDS